MTISDMQTILCSMARNSIRLTIGGQPDTGVGADRFGGWDCSALAFFS